MTAAQNGWLEIAGFRIGHAQDAQALTGCTVILCEAGAVAGVDQRGGAPGTRETDALRPMHLVEHAHAVLLTGGSAFGLDAASGVMRYLEEQEKGYPTGVARVPIVPAAVLFDLGLGRSDIRPDAAMGYAACLNARPDHAAEGNIGAGTGATVGKLCGMSQAMKSGLGIAHLHLAGDLRIVAVAAVNAFGDVVDPRTGACIAGLRTTAGRLANTLEMLYAQGGQPPAGSPCESNTTIGVVLTNARLNREQANKVAQMAQDGLARAVQPAHTMLDGDTIFMMAYGDVAADVNLVGALAAEVFAAAVVRAVRQARSAGNLPAACDLPAE
jgi:L-aminopeptidase/D-esterase-like protein